ncbi:unnamed protein product [Lupinus luteus]|uniref:Prolamin-like domain-containing protein n=1 Tax=Lupinus luteus TaxID=3873 RepID=A0AAV1XYE1_LUPLU
MMLPSAFSKNSQPSSRICRQTSMIRHHQAEPVTSAATTFFNFSSTVKFLQSQQPETSLAEGMNDDVEVPRPPNSERFSIFEFGLVAATNEKITLAGYCLVSEDLEPCCWEILPVVDSNYPQFCVVF